MFLTKNTILFFTFKILMFWCFSLNAQEIRTSYKTYSIENGLSSNQLNDIVQDGRGLFWIATKNGLSRFDGFNFINFSHENSKALFENEGISKLYQHGHFIYLLYKGKGIVALNTLKSSFKRISTKGIQTMNIVGDTTTYLYTNGMLEVTIKKKIIARRKFNNVDHGNAICYHGKIYLSIPDIRPIVLDAQSLKTNKELFLPINGDFLVSKQHKIIYYSGKKVFIINPDNNHHISNLIESKNFISYFSEDLNGFPLYIENFKFPNYVMNNTSIVLHFENDQNYEVKKIIRINNNCFFVTTNQGLIKVDLKAILSSKLNEYTETDKTFIRVRRKIVEDNQGVLYFLGYPNIIGLKNEKQFVIESTPMTSYDGMMFKNKLFFTTEGSGLYSYSTKTKKTKKYITNDISEKAVFYHISTYQDSLLLLSGKDHIVLFDVIHNKSKAFLLDKGIDIYTLKKDSIQNLYYAATSKGVYKFSLDFKHGITHKKIANKNIIKTNDILILPKENQIWIATDDGIYVHDYLTLNLINQYKTLEDISNPIITSFVQDLEGRIWASTYSGITVFNPKTNKSIQLTKKIGLKNEEFNYKSSLLKRDGKIILGGLNAFEEINPSLFFNYHENKKLDFFITAIEYLPQINKKTYIFPEKDPKTILFNTGKEEIDIHFSNLNYPFVNDNKFTYQINNNLPVRLTNNIVRISNLENGLHQLKIKMLDPFGNEIKEKNYTLSAYKPYLETKSFLKLLIYLAAFLLIAGIILLSFVIYYSKKVIFEIKNTKSKIAMDLHDEAGSTLTRLFMLTRSKNIAPNERELVNNGLQEVLFSMRTFMDSLIREKSKTSMLCAEIIEFLQLNYSNSKTDIITDVNINEDRLIPNVLFRDLKLCIYEIVINSQKHANCKNLILKIMEEKESLVIQILDDGILTDINILSSSRNGIRNIKKRVERNNGKIKFNINESTSQGLEITMQFPSNEKK